MQNAVEANGVQIARTPTGIAVRDVRGITAAAPLCIEADRAGKRLQTYWLDRWGEWREYFGSAVDHTTVGIRVKEGERVLAELPEDDLLPFMKLRVAQVHVTENYVAVPPALTITDSVGAVWTLGFVSAPPEQSPRGEYAFEVLRDGVGAGEVASRIERRGGKIRVFTRHGWRNWTGNSFV